MNDSSFVNIMLAGSLAVAGLYYFYAQSWSIGAGESYWTTFMSDIQSKLASGSLPSKILADYGAAEERERDRAALIRSQQAGSGSSSFLGAALGALAGSMIRR